MAIARSILVDVEATPYYHCISRCVRRAFLCGADPVTGKSFDHRKQWVVERMKTLAGVFTVDVCAYAAMSNHFHIVVRIDRQRALRLSDADVVERYGSIFPQARRRLDRAGENDRIRLIARWRERLWSLSWYMRCLNEGIARRANEEDECSGRFWEGRFRSQALLDEGAVVTCMSYVDLNPIRAGIASNLEESPFTSIRERITAANSKDEGGPADRIVIERGAGDASMVVRGSAAPRSVLQSWREGDLVPFLTKSVFGDEGGGLGAPIPIRFRDYVELLREAASWLRGEREENSGLSPVPRATLAGVGLSAVGFIESVRDFPRNFFTMVGETHRIEVECQRRGYRRRVSLNAARTLYRAAS